LPSNLRDILRTTVARIEERAALGPDDPAVAEVKKNVLRVITELEVAKTEQPEGVARRSQDVGAV
jgi:hypothetical protein